MKLARRIWRMLIDLARELADESAYERYLKRAGTVHSAQTWRDFSEQQHARKYSNAKCC